MHKSTLLLTGISLFFSGMVAPQASRAQNIGQGVIDTVRGKDSRHRKSFRDRVQGPIDIIRGKKSGPAEKLKGKGQGFIDIVRGKKSKEAAKLTDNIETSVKDAGYFVDEHKEAIALVAVVAATGYMACSVGCDILLGIGEGAIHVGSVAAGGSAGAATAAAEVVKAKEKESRRASRTTGSTSPDIDDLTGMEPVAVRTIDPSLLSWRFGNLIGGKTPKPAADSQTAFEAFKAGALSLIKKEPGWGLLLDLSMPTTANPAEWSEDMETAARLQKLIGDAAAYHYWTLEMKERPPLIDPKVVDAMDNKGPRVVAKDPDIIVQKTTISLKDVIAVEAKILGSLTGLSPEETERKVRAGIKLDVQAIPTTPPKAPGK